MSLSATRENAEYGASLAFIHHPNSCLGWQRAECFKKRNGVVSCSLHIHNICTCWGTELHNGCSPLPLKAGKILPVTTTAVSNFHVRKVQDS